MKFETSTVHIFKTNALRWLRLQQRCAFIATEVGPFSADVFGVSEKKQYEIEVKVSMSDLRADLKKYKHRQYNGTQYGSNSDLAWHPSYFYYCVPREIVEQALTIFAKEETQKYGLICGEDMTVIRPPRRLHEREPASGVKFQMALRMGSDLIRFYDNWVK